MLTLADQGGSKLPLADNTERTQLLLNDYYQLVLVKKVIYFMISPFVCSFGVVWISGTHDGHGCKV